MLNADNLLAKANLHRIATPEYDNQDSNLELDDNTSEPLLYVIIS